MTQLSIQFVTVGVSEVSGSPAFSSPTGLYGVERVSDHHVVVLPGTELDEGAAVWTYDVEDTEGADDEVYRYYIDVTADGVEYFVSRTTNYVKSACLVVGRYATSVDMEARFGTEELVKWLGCGDDEEPTEYATRLSYHLEDAASWIDDELRGFVTVPATTPRKIKDLCVDAAAVRAYESRGVVDFDPVTGQPHHRLAFVSKRLQAEMDKIKNGTVRLEADTRKRYIDAT